MGGLPSGKTGKNTIGREEIAVTRVHFSYDDNLPLEQALADAQNRCLGRGLRQDNAGPRAIDDATYQSAKEKCTKLLVSGNETLHIIKKHFAGTGFGLALFDDAANLLRFYGDKIFEEWLKGKEIRRKTNWKEECAGPTAVSLGMEYLQPVSTEGGQHFSAALQGCAIHYAPICIDRSENNRSLNGGLAIIGPADAGHDDYLIVADAVAHRIALQIIWIESLNVMDMDGFIYVDRATGKFKILYINQGVFVALNLPYQDYTFHELEELVEVKYNSFFWDALVNRKTIHDMEMVLYVSGKHRNVNVSLTHLTVVNHRIDGACVAFNSRRRISNIVSGQGTSAVFTFDRIVGQNHHFLETMERAKAAAKYDSNILLLGESGVGKDIVAQSIHNESSRKNNPFIAINCAAFPRELIASELFGYEDGTFTGGKRGGKVGKFELANHGTIFLDEIGDMPLDLQASLLRVIEEKSFMRVGGSKMIRVDVRIVAATNKNLKRRVHQNEFRSDLYFRLSTVSIKIPALQQRRDDIILLSAYFIGKVATRVGKIPPKLTAGAKEYLLRYNWPGNIRELQNLFEGIIQIFDEPHITEEQIAFYLRSSGLEVEPPEIHDSYEEAEQTDPAPPQNEREAYRRALEKHQFHRGKTADFLGISRKTLYRKMKKFGLD